MGLNSTGKHTLPSGYKAAPNTTIRTSQHNPPLEDISNSLSLMVVKDGRAALTGNLNFGNNRATGLAAGINPSDGINKAQADTKIDAVEVVVSGTVDATVLTPTTALTDYPESVVLTWASVGPNTIAAPTVRIGTLAIKTIISNGGGTIPIGATGPAGYIVQAVYNGTDFVLLNPSVNAAGGVRGIIRNADFVNTAVTYSQSGTTVTVTGAGINFKVGHGITVEYGSGARAGVDVNGVILGDRLMVVTAVGTNSATFTSPVSASTTGVGTVPQVVSKPSFVNVQNVVGGFRTTFGLGHFQTWCVNFSIDAPSTDKMLVMATLSEDSAVTDTTVKSVRGGFRSTKLANFVIESSSAAVFDLNSPEIRTAFQVLW